MRTEYLDLIPEPKKLHDKLLARYLDHPEARIKDEDKKKNPRPVNLSRSEILELSAIRKVPLLNSTNIRLVDSLNLARRIRQIIDLLFEAEEVTPENISEKNKSFTKEGFENFFRGFEQIKVGQQDFKISDLEKVIRLQANEDLVSKLDTDFQTQFGMQFVQVFNFLNQSVNQLEKQFKLAGSVWDKVNQVLQQKLESIMRPMAEQWEAMLQTNPQNVPIQHRLKLLREALNNGLEKWSNVKYNPQMQQVATSSDYYFTEPHPTSKARAREFYSKTGFSSVQELKEDLEDKDVLDLGCGLGALAITAKAAGLNSKIYGLSADTQNYSPEQILAGLTQLGRTLGDNSPTPDVGEVAHLKPSDISECLSRIERGNWEEIPYADESMDRIYSVDAFPKMCSTVTQANKVLAEIFRVLRAGGTARLSGILQDVKNDKPLSLAKPNYINVIKPLAEAAGFVVEAKVNSKNATDADEQNRAPFMVLMLTKPIKNDQTAA